MNRNRARTPTPGRTTTESIITHTDPAQLGQIGSGVAGSAIYPGLDPRLWMLLSPTLPIGGYSFSHGLETAVLSNVVNDHSSARQWIQTLGSRVLPTLELPLVLRLFRACKDQDLRAANHWNDMAHATRETAELYEEEVAKGQALQRLFEPLNVEPAISIDQPGFSAAYAQVCASWDLSETVALMGYGWIWFETLVAAAIKLVPLGHTDGLKLLATQNARLESLADAAMRCADDNIGANTPGLALLSSAHEHQHARQFRS